MLLYFVCLIFSIRTVLDLAHKSLDMMFGPLDDIANAKYAREVEIAKQVKDLTDEYLKHLKEIKSGAYITTDEVEMTMTGEVKDAAISSTDEAACATTSEA